MLRARSDQLAVGVLFIVIAALACFAPVQGDTWWLLRAGRDIVATHHVSLVDSYSWTAAGLYWPNHEWLTEVVFYSLFRLGGLPLVTACCAAVIVAAWAMCWRLTRGSFELRFLLFGICVNTSATVWAIRPQVFTMLFFVATIVLLVRRKLWLIPLVLLVWANFHGAVLLGLVAIAGTFVSALVFERRIAWDLGAAGVCSFAATCVSPMGAGLWPFILHSVERSKINQLVEWQPPGLAVWFWPFWAVAAALAVLTIWRWRAVDRETGALTAIALAMLPLAVQSQRNVPVFLLAAIPAASRLLAGTSAKTAPRVARTDNPRLNAALLAGAGLVAAFVVSGAWLAPPVKLGWTPIAPSAAEAIRSCGGPLYNMYGDGGVLIWFVPEQKVFIDNRQDPYPPDLLRMNRAAELDGKFAELEQTYQPHCAALTAASPLARQLSVDPAWQRRYADAQWVVYAR